MTTPTRRELLRTGGAVLAPLAARALLSPASAPAATTAGPYAPLPLTERLQRLIGVELLLAFCYRHILASSILSPRARRTVTPFVAHEQAHIAALQRLLRARGGRMPAPPADVQAANRDLAQHKVGGRLGQLKGDLDAVRLLLTTEQVTIGAYDIALTTLEGVDADTTELFCQIMATEAQHDAVLGLLLPPGRIGSAVPYGLVEGLL